MRKIFSVLAIAMATITSVFADDDFKANVIDKDVPVTNFEKICLKGSDKVVFTQGDKPSVRIRGRKDAVDAVVINQDGKMLEISRKNNNGEGLSGLWKAIKNESVELVVYVTSPDLTDVMLVGSGDFDGKGNIDTDKLNITLTGSGDIDFDNIICDVANIELKGSGDIDIDKIESISTNVSLRGSGDVEISQFNVRKTDLNLMGSGDIKVNCSKCDEVNASIAGSGDITIFGQYKMGTKSVRGSGDINQR